MPAFSLASLASFFVSSTFWKHSRLWIDESGIVHLHNDCSDIPRMHPWHSCCCIAVKMGNFWEGSNSTNKSKQRRIGPVTRLGSCSHSSHSICRYVCWGERPFLRPSSCLKTYVRREEETHLVIFQHIPSLWKKKPIVRACTSVQEIDYQSFCWRKECLLYERDKPHL